MENRLTELWSIFDFTNHGYLGSFGQFQKQFVVPIERDNEKARNRSAAIPNSSIPITENEKG